MKKLLFLSLIIGLLSSCTRPEYRSGQRATKANSIDTALLNKSLNAQSKETIRMVTTSLVVRAVIL